MEREQREEMEREMQKSRERDSRVGEFVSDTDPNCVCTD